MYSNANVCTRTADGFSSEIPVHKGVHQGNTLSPTLFNVIINGNPQYSEVGAHDLQIERNRYTNMPKKNRKCTWCGVIEDDFHFLDNCIKFEKLRSRLIKRHK